MPTCRKLHTADCRSGHGSLVISSIVADPSTGSSSGFEAAFAALASRFGQQLSFSSDVCRQHCGSETFYRPHPPDAVMFAESTVDVVDAMRMAASFRLPVIPFGAGTSLEGHTDALHGGLSIDLSRMSRILAVNERDLDATVEAGVTREQLNIHLRDTGMFFPVDPGANATIGGMPSSVRVWEYSLSVLSVSSDVAIVLISSGFRPASRT